MRKCLLILLMCVCGYKSSFAQRTDSIYVFFTGNNQSAGCLKEERFGETRFTISGTKTKSGILKAFLFEGGLQPTVILENLENIPSFVSIDYMIRKYGQDGGRKTFIGKSFFVVEKRGEKYNVFKVKPNALFSVGIHDYEENINIK